MTQIKQHEKLIIKSNIQLPNKIVEYITSQYKIPKEEIITMLDFLLTNNINFINNYNKKNTQILDNNVLIPFWNKFLNEETKKIWFPIISDLKDLDLTSTNLYSKCLDPKSKLWKPIENNISKTFQIKSYQSSQSSKQDTIEILKTRKIRISISLYK